MTTPRPTSEEAVVKALASHDDLTSAEIASTAGLGTLDRRKSAGGAGASRRSAQEPWWPRWRPNGA